MEIEKNKINSDLHTCMHSIYTHMTTHAHIHTHNLEWWNMPVIQIPRQWSQECWEIKSILITQWVQGQPWLHNTQKEKRKKEWREGRNKEIESQNKKYLFISHLHFLNIYSSKFQAILHHWGQLCWFDYECPLRLMYLKVWQQVMVLLGGVGLWE